jgi:hypothetical protein
MPSFFPLVLSKRTAVEKRKQIFDKKKEEHQKSNGRRIEGGGE